ncbi:hypothetical protein [Alteromonas sp. ASW11-130]|uniref:hypothetical protein n=1 Tax=Alteromonas sp. ASW11-130 TaxID=3015775 RepID=UPI002242C093|nr:hypothetical protein [Alteromonas sp. ASW11-130]MCW8091161.1 hypothetical protein [Alteromonas sp. ASW11-130]
MKISIQSSLLRQLLLLQSLLLCSLAYGQTNEKPKDKDSSSSELSESINQSAEEEEPEMLFSDEEIETDYFSLEQEPVSSFENEDIAKTVEAGPVARSVDLSEASSRYKKLKMDLGGDDTDPNPEWCAEKCKEGSESCDELIVLLCSSINTEIE